MIPVVTAGRSAAWIFAKKERNPIAIPNFWSGLGAGLERAWSGLGAGLEKKRIGFE